MKHTTMAIVFRFDWCIQPRLCPKRHHCTIVTTGSDPCFLTRFDLAIEPKYVEFFVAGETQALHALSRLKLQRQDPHAHQVAPVDALVAFGDDCPDS